MESATVTGTEAGREVRYFGLFARGEGRKRHFVELEVVRQGGRQVSQTETGVTYRTLREAQAENARKNTELYQASKAKANAQ